MEAKTWQATIMSDEQIRALKLEAIQIAWSHKFHPPFEKEKHLLETQAEISFKAGEKKVAEFSIPILNKISVLVVDIRSDWNDPRARCREIHSLISEWQAFLKSEGIE